MQSSSPRFKRRHGNTTRFSPRGTLLKNGFSSKSSMSGRRLQSTRYSSCWRDMTLFPTSDDGSISNKSIAPGRLV